MKFWLDVRAMRFGWWLMGTSLKRPTWRWRFGVRLFEWGAGYTRRKVAA